MNGRNWLVIYVAALVFLASLQMLFAFRTNNYFSVDDFQVLAYFKNHGLGETAVNFLIQGDIFGYKKIIGHLVFGWLFKTFGATPNPFIFTLFLLQTANLALLYLIVRKLTKSDATALLAGVLYNKFYLFYFSNIHEVTAAFFCLVSILLFLFQQKKIYLSLAAYVLALLSKELAYSLPFFLLTLAFVGKGDKKRTIPYFVVLSIYVLFQALFMFSGRFASFASSYGATLSLSNLWSSFSFYFYPYLIAFLVLLAAVSKKYKELGILAVAVITIAPVLFFGARREAYYLYVPMIYLLIYLSMVLPKLTIKSGALYLAILLVFGGRSVFPRIAWQMFPNWQKVSVENVAKRVEEGIQNEPKEATISLGGITLERDAQLMLGQGVVDLFIDDGAAKRYAFSYLKETNEVIATKK